MGDMRKSGFTNSTEFGYKKNVHKFQTDQNFHFSPLDKDLDSELFQIFCIAPTNVWNIRNIGMLKSWPTLVQHKICLKMVDNEDIEIFVVGGE